MPTFLVIIILISPDDGEIQEGVRWQGKDTDAGFSLCGPHGICTGLHPVRISYELLTSFLGFPNTL